MKNESIFLNIKARLERLIAERNSMVIENRIREIKGESPAYGESAFLALAKEFESIEQETQSLINLGV